MKNPEIEGIKILLQERMPEKAIITKEKKEKIEKLKPKDQIKVLDIHKSNDKNRRFAYNFIFIVDYNFL